MAHFYGTVQGGRGEAARIGHKSTGLTTSACSWQGRIDVQLWHDETTGRDRYTVTMNRHGNSRGLDGFVLAEGYLGEMPLKPEGWRTFMAHETLHDGVKPATQP